MGETRAGGIAGLVDTPREGVLPNAHPGGREMPQNGDRDPKSEDREEKPWARLSVLAAAGTQLGAVLGASAFVGAMLDRLLGTGPWLSILFVFSGFFGGFWNFLKILKRYGPPSDRTPDKGDAGDDG